MSAMNQQKKKGYWQHWLNKRFKQGPSWKQLRQKDVLIFLNKEGVLYGVLLILTFVSGINYANNLILALCFLLSSILVVSFYLAFKQLHQLNVQVEVAHLAQVGQPLPVVLNLKPAHRQLHLHLRCKFVEQAKKISILQAPISLTFHYLPPQRGLCRLPRMLLYSVYPFAIVKTWSYLYPQAQIWVRPAAIEVSLSRFGLNQNALQSQNGIEDFSHLKNFQQGDALNRIAWQQLAKGRGLLVKQFEAHRQDQLHFDYFEMPATEHEQKLGQLMYLVEQAHTQQRAFSIKLRQQQLNLGQGQQHYIDACLMLAQEP